MPDGIVFEVSGMPRPQPRGRHVGTHVVSTTGPAKRWRAQVKEAATVAGLAAMPDGRGGIRPLLGAVELVLLVRFPTKKPERVGGWRTAIRNADFDNLQKLVADAAVDAGLLGDDGQVSRAVYEGVWCAPGSEGVTVAMRALQARRGAAAGHGAGTGVAQGRAKPASGRTGGSGDGLGGEGPPAWLWAGEV